MPSDRSSYYNGKTREQLVRELAEVRRRLAEMDNSCQEIFEECARWKSQVPAENCCGLLTSRKKAEAALRESEERFVKAFEESPIAMAISRLPDGRIENVNATFLKLFGYARQEIIGRTSIELEMVRAAKREEMLGTVGTEGGIREWEIDIRTRQGAVRRGSVSAIKIEVDGEPRLLTMFLDITARKKAEEDLRKSEAQFRDAFAHVPVGMVVTDLKGLFLHVNAAYCRITGYSEQELLQPDFTFQQLTHPDDLRGNLKEMRRLKAGKIPAFFLEKRYLRKDGTTVWVRASISAQRDASGLPQRIVGLVEDISERKQAEEALRLANERTRTILESISDGFLAYDKQWRISYLNENGARMLGLKREELIGGLLWELFPHAATTKFYKEYRRAVETQTPVHFEEYYPEPLNFWLECHAYPTKDGLSVFFRDITQRKSAEEALKESEEHKRLALEAADLGTWRHDFAGGTVRLDTGGQRCLGFDREVVSLSEVIGRVHPEDADRLQQEISKNIDPVNGTERYDTEYRVVHPDGSIRWLSVQVRVLFDGQGSRRTPLSGYGTVKDITVRKKADDELRQTRDTLQAVLDAAPAGVVVADNTGRILMSSVYAHDIMGGPVSGDAHAPSNGCRISTVDGSLIPQGRSPLSQALAGMTVSDEEVRVTRADGTQRIILTGATPLRDEKGEVWGAVTIFQDITERKQTEEALRESTERLRTVLAQIPAGLLIAEAPSGRLLFSNAQVASIFRHAADRSYTMEDYASWKMYHPNGRQYNVSEMPLVRALQYGETSTNEEMEIIRGDRTRGVLSVNAAPIRGSDGRIVAAVAAFMDITERKRYEEGLRHWNESLEQRVAERTELAEARARQLQALAVELIEAEERERRRIAELLHDDLQQLLASARLQLQGASQGLPPTHALVNVERVLDESIRKSRRLSHELSPAVLHHSGLISALEWLIQQMGEQFELEVAFNAEEARQFDEAPLKVFIFRAVQELLFNVVKHADVKKARVSLSGSEAGLSVAVTDQGRGFDPDLTEAAGMKGFGLLRLRERARSIGGILTIESAPGYGSRFTLKVPLTLAKDAILPGIGPALDRQTPIAAAHADPMTKTGTRVLFADDHRVMRQGLIRLIAGQPNIQVVGEAANGREAVEMVRQVGPDVVVMDVSMPEMDGVEATRRIKSEFPDVRVIGLSMYEDEHIAVTMCKAGAESLLSKTTSSADLLKAIYGFEAGEEDER